MSVSSDWSYASILLEQPASANTSAWTYAAVTVNDGDPGDGPSAWAYAVIALTAPPVNVEFSWTGTAWAPTTELAWDGTAWQ